MSIEKLSTNASLKDVMDKFEEISFQDFFSIDIVVKNELPSVVKNNQVVIIGDPTAKIYIDNKHIDNITLGNNDVYVKYGYEAGDGYSINKTSGNKNIKLHILHIYKCLDGVIVPVDEVYIGKDNTWVQILNSRLDIFRHGEYTNDNLTMFKKLANESYASDTFVKILPDSHNNYPNTLYFSISGTSYSRAGDIYFCSTEPIDFTRFSKLVFKVDYYKVTTSTAIAIGEGDKATTNNYVVHTLSKGNGTDVTIELDVSNINDYAYIKLYNASVADTHNIYISDIYLTI